MLAQIENEIQRLRCDWEWVSFLETNPQTNLLLKSDQIEEQQIQIQMSTNTNTELNRGMVWWSAGRTDDGVRVRRVQMNSAAAKLPQKFLLMISTQTPQISMYTTHKYVNKFKRQREEIPKQMQTNTHYNIKSKKLFQKRHKTQIQTKISRNIKKTLETHIPSLGGFEKKQLYSGKGSQDQTLSLLGQQILLSFANKYRQEYQWIQT